MQLKAWTQATLQGLDEGLVCRDAEVLSLFAAIITKLRELMAPEVPRVFEAIFECTLQMITKNFAVGPLAAVCHHLLHAAQGSVFCTACRPLLSCK